jgi:hypothetical protein
MGNTMVLRTWFELLSGLEVKDESDRKNRRGVRTADLSVGRQHHRGNY